METAYTVITSRKNQAVCDASALEQKKFRDLSGTFPIEGIKLFAEAIEKGLNVEKVFFTEDALDKHKELLLSTAADKFLVTQEVFSKLSTEKSPQGIYACVKKPEVFLLSDDTKALKEGGFVILDNIQNPQNVGATIRVCLAFGFDKIIFSRGCADIFSPKCLRAAMGSLFAVKPYYSEMLEDDISFIKSHGNKVYCAALDRESKKLGDFSFNCSDSFIIGNEGHGVTQSVKQMCDSSLFIPISESSESLNAATAAAVIMWEMSKSK